MYLGKKLQEFEDNRSTSNYDSIIEPPTRVDATRSGNSLYFLPRIFFWSPGEQFDVDILCPVHHCQLRKGFWRDKLENVDPRNLRLVDDLFENLILSQRFYCCKLYCRFLSACFDLPPPEFAGRANLPLCIFNRTCCTNALIDTIYRWVTHGVNFTQMSDFISNLNYNCYWRKLQRFILETYSTQQNSSLSESDDFNNQVMFSCSSRAKIIQIFPDEFQQRKHSITRLCVHW